MDLKKSPYNEIDENVYEKIKSELPMENTNVYEQFLADIPLNNIGSVKIDKGNDNSDGLKKDLSVSANEKKKLFRAFNYEIFADYRNPLHQKEQLPVVYCLLISVMHSFSCSFI